MDQISLAAVRAATAANQRALDALNLVNAPRPDPRKQTLIRQLSLADMITDLMRERKTGANREWHEEQSRSQNAQFSNSYFFPLEAFAPATRADTVAASGFPIEALTLPAADALRPLTVAAGLGATVIPLPANGNFSAPVQSGTATAYMLGSETATITEANQGFTSIQFTPRTVGAYTEFSRQLNLQAPGINDVITRDHGQLVGRMIDLKALYGAGTGGEPVGIANTAGIGTFSATSASLTSLIAAQTALGNGLRPSAGYATTLAVAGTLRGRQEFTSTAVTLWQGSLLDGTLAGLPARSSTALAAGDILLGSWEFLMIPIWGALEIALNPFGDSTNSNFRSGVIGLRTFLTFDVGLTYPAAFSLGSSFT